jgi:hypothetical protein
VDTVNVGSRAPVKPLFYMALREGGPTATNGRRPRSGRVSDQDTATGSDPEIIPVDHIPTILAQAGRRQGGNQSSQNGRAAWKMAAADGRAARGEIHAGRARGRARAG